jgi:hypothetical protein
MALRKSNAVFLQKLIEVQQYVKMIRSLLINDEALAALHNAGVDCDTIKATVDVARLLFLRLLDLLRGSLALNFPHIEHTTTIRLLVSTTNQAFVNLMRKEEVRNLRRISACYIIEEVYNIVGLAIRSEIGTRSEGAR